MWVPFTSDDEASLAFRFTLEASDIRPAAAAATHPPAAHLLASQPLSVRQPAVAAERQHAAAGQQPLTPKAPRAGRIVEA